MQISTMFTTREIKKYQITEPYLNISCALGEGPFWERESNTLRFVDIVGRKLHTVDLSRGPESHKQWNLDFSIGITADIEGNDQEFIFGGKRGYGLFNKRTGAHRIIREMWNDVDRKPDAGGKPGAGRCKEDRMRSNDGAVDAKGRFFVGAMNDQELVKDYTDEGSLFRLDPDLSVHRVANNLTIPNGTSWTKDNKTMYFTDTPSGKIMAYPYDVEKGEISFVDGKALYTAKEGAPDGHCQDEEGHFWVACYGAGKVVRVDPSGNVVAEVQLPTRSVTCPVLCGTELFITTAAEDDPTTYPESAKYQGAVFKVDVGVHGAPINKFKLQGNI